MSVPSTDPRSWLDAELGRIWLLAELCYRHLQTANLRAQTSQAAPDLDAVLAARAAARGGARDLDVLAKELAVAEREVEQQRLTSPLGVLAKSLRLTRLELETLVFVVAPHVDPPLADLFHVIRGGVRRGVNLALVTQLLRLSREDRVSLISAIDPERALVAHRLITVATDLELGAAQRSIQPTFGLVELLAHGDALSSGVAQHARLVRAEATFDDLILDPTLRETSMRACLGSAAAWTLLWGIRGSGKTELASRIAAHANRPLVVLDIMAADKAARPELVRLAKRDALVLDAGLYVGPLTVNDEAKDLVKRFAGYAGLLLFGIETSRPPNLRIDHRVREIAVGLPDGTARALLWQRAIGGGEIATLEPIARAFQLSPGEILAAGAEATALASAERRGVVQADLRRSVERRLRNDLQDFAWRIETKVSWSDIVLPPEAHGRVEEFIGRRTHAHKVYGEWGLGNRLERGKGSIALFSGPPGTGKTMLAGLIAKGLGLDLYQVDMSQIQSKWIGETEKALGRLFDLAERAHAVLLFDEADSLLSKRTDGEDSTDRYANANVNYLLQRLESYSGVVVMTTNKDTALDEALQRRLTLHLRLDVPEIPERERLWSSFLPISAPRETDLDLPALAREFELTGGIIKNVVVRAAFLAALEDRRLGTELLWRAATLELEDMGRVVCNAV